MSNYDRVLGGEIFSLIDLCDTNAKAYMTKAKNVFYQKIAKDPQKMSLEVGAYSMYKILLDVFIPATFNKVNSRKLSFRDSRALDLMGINAPSPNEDLCLAFHRVIDFITGMTDSYAIFISRQFSGTGSGQ